MSRISQGAINGSHAHDHDTVPGHPQTGSAGMNHAGHGNHVAQFRRLFWIMLVVALPVVFFSDTFTMILGYQLPRFPLVVWISPVFGTVMYVWGGRHSSPAQSRS